MCDYKNDEEIKKEIETAWNKMHNECSTHSTGTFYIHDDGWHPILNNAICDSELKVSIRKENVDFDENRMSNVCYDGDDIEVRDMGDYYIDLMPNIEDVRVVNKPNTDEPKVVMVDFADGTTEKAVLSDEDTYSLETGISICITKKLMSVSDSVSGTKVYNSVIRHAMKVMKENREWEDEARRADEAEKQREKKLAEKRARRQARREAAEKEKLIDMLAEAINRAKDKRKTKG
ncbi:MAG: hypothetical protein II453_06390 [Alphaproteobacteria bacterium]|nr:hypothetical protein [Alphaproteobacteria bacterium]